MAEKERKEVRISEQFLNDITSVYEYGEGVFGSAAAKSFVSEIYGKIWSLDKTWLHYPECRHLPTKGKRYRNIILGSYLVIYRVTKGKILVLRILHAHSSITRIKSSRSVKE